MSSVREDILVRLTAIAGGVAGTTSYRGREAPVGRAEGPVILVHPDEEQVTLNASRLALRDLIVNVTLVIRGDNADTLSDPILVALHASIMTDTNLAALCALVREESTKYDFEMADTTALTVQVKYLVRYLTNANSLTAIT